jgi:C4-dicarboxylate transporter DctM subunit
MTPPLGENIFVASGIGGSSVEQIVARIPPFFLAQTIALFVIAFFPVISLWLPRMMGY